MSAFGTVTVTVQRFTSGDLDDLGNAQLTAQQPEQVAGCLVHPGSTADMDAERPDGVTVALTVHFPKTYTSSLRGCLLGIPGYGTFKVVGDPQHYMAANTPGEWSMAVECEATDG